MTTTTREAEVQKLIDRSVAIYPGDLLYYPQWRLSQEVTADQLPDAESFADCYAVNNSTIAYIYEGQYYVTKVTSSNLKLLNECGFIEQHFFVALSIGEIIISDPDRACRWDQIEEAARLAHQQELKRVFAEWSDEHGIRPLDEAVLRRCFVIPDGGIQVKHFWHDYEKWEMPKTVHLDCTLGSTIGKFDANNGVVVFVNRDGRTYVAHGYWIIKVLEDHGFEKGSWYVPFSNGEVIQDPVLAQRWEALAN
ncbi:hypothetical protein IKF15_02665 [Candidatus Saccharibacteria bacterium]|nr:hypothetical protein [Candidatus Saccharibacteria bacterium]